MNDLKNLKTLEYLLKDKNYFGYKFYTVFRHIEYDSYEITFLNDENKYFRIQLCHGLILGMEYNNLIGYIDNMVHSSSDFKKLAHNQQFMNKFDKMLHE